MKRTTEQHHKGRSVELTRPVSRDWYGFREREERDPFSKRERREMNRSLIAALDLLMSSTTTSSRRDRHRALPATRHRGRDSREQTTLARMCAVPVANHSVLPDARCCRSFVHRHWPHAGLAKRAIFRIPGHRMHTCPCTCPCTIAETATAAPATAHARTNKNIHITHRPARRIC